MDTPASPQTVFVKTEIDLTGARGGLLGGTGKARQATGKLRAPHADLVLWRVIEHVTVEKGLEQRAITPAEDGQSVTYSYAVRGGGGGLFPLEEPGHFAAELTAAFLPPSFMPDIGRVEIISTSVPPEAEHGKPAALRRSQSFSLAQLEGRLIRGSEADRAAIWYVEHGVKRALASPTCGRLRFGDGWQRLIQTLTEPGDAALVPDGAPVTLAEAAEGKLVYSWPEKETYLVEGRRKRRIDAPLTIAARFGEHWRVKLIHLRRPELDSIPDGEPIT